MLNTIICVLIGYLFGTSNLAFFISKFNKVNHKEQGSKNLGTANATIVLGPKFGVLVFLHDTIKVVLAVLLCKWLFPTTPHLTYVVGVAAVVGHIFPFYLGFKGGKGFASYIGLTFMVDWRFGLIMLVAIGVVALITDWLVASTFFTIAVTPIFVAFIHIIPAAIVCIASALIFIKHIENIKKKKLGQEIGIRQTLFKKKKNE